MFLYWLATENRYVHRQADVPKGVEAERVDVPTDITGLMAYLNALVTPRPQDAAPPALAEPEEAEAPIEEPPEPAPPQAPMNAIALLSRVDSPGVDVEGVIEAIAKARGYALARYASAVSIRFQELEKI